jgi:tRNA(fMet)-specific endonuclease VapC
MNRFLIDTNIYSAALRGDPKIARTLSAAERIGFSVISVAELLDGFARGGHESKNRDELKSFLDSPRVTLFGIDEHTAEHYATIIGLLKKRGTPIPTNDIWIGAVAFRQGLPLMTLDRHFSQVPGLTLSALL